MSGDDRHPGDRHSSGGRQLLVGMLMALMSAALVLGSLSLSLFESGYALGQQATAALTQIVFSGQQIITLAGTEPGLVLSTPTAPGCNYPDGWVAINISADVSLRSLAQAYGTSEEALKAGNCMKVSSLAPGSQLYVPLVATQTLPVFPTATVCRLPYGWSSYYIRAGDTLAGLAARVGMTAASLQAANCLSSSYIYSGQLLYLPYIPAVYPTATRWPTLASPQATFLPSTPTRYVTPRPSDTPGVITVTQPPTDTPETPVPPASDTPLPPPDTDTPLPPPDTDTPLPPPDTDTPLPPATDTPQPPPTDPPPPTNPPPPTPTSGSYPFP